MYSEKIKSIMEELDVLNSVNEKDYPDNLDEIVRNEAKEMLDEFASAIKKNKYKNRLTNIDVTSDGPRLFLYSRVDADDIEEFKKEVNAAIKVIEDFTDSKSYKKYKSQKEDKFIKDMRSMALFDMISKSGLTKSMI